MGRWEENEGWTEDLQSELPFRMVKGEGKVRLINLSHLKGEMGGGGILNG